MPVGTLRRWITFWYNLPGRVATRMWVSGEVNYAMKYNFEVLSRQYAVVALFVRHLAYARGLKAATENLKDHGEFGGPQLAHIWNWSWWNGARSLARMAKRRIGRIFLQRALRNKLVQSHATFCAIDSSSSQS
jgi:hypothetical protein